MAKTNRENLCEAVCELVSLPHTDFADYHVVIMNLH